MAADVLLSWGANSYGQLSQGHAEDILCPTRISFSNEVHLLAGGGGHTMLIDGNGNVYSCGWNKKGQLGLGDVDDRHHFQHVPNLTAVKFVACGWNHTLIITDNHRLFVFGCNTFGQLGLGTANGCYLSPTPCHVGQGVIHVGAGLRHSVVLLDDGTVWSWGDNKKGQLGIPGLQMKRVLKPMKVSRLMEKCIQVIAGSQHSAVLTESGQVFCWGSNQHGQCGLPVSSEAGLFDEPQLIGGALSNHNVTSIHSGWSHLIAQIGVDDVYSWGRSDYGQLGLGDEIVLQRYSSFPSKIPNLNNIKHMMCGAEHNIALLENGKVLTWGWNEHGICGSQDEANIHRPRLVSLPEDFRAVRVGCGGGHTFIALKPK
ncbi:secretion-regulating guanine nucleotide exchange factor isoform X2 [Exaiptasia diaphana]|uniref:RCC1-like domain-containing protein n=1 Tax=Exaiptasia diaphana TaxID=2652724 RepID=A0A913XRW1_EXADI|nr:secretion-regulating guanine nucleotide exchange factor isoform X2 [Exaiptasia diaphana]KXJ09918.1 Secretion-regulating guanine nucleotide exchange factor [Exaiptasia diaphana]